MTREEAIEALTAIKDEATEDEHSVCYVTSEDADAINMAIEALNNVMDKPNDVVESDNDAIDLISRQALCQYALNQKDKSVTPNDIMRFPSAETPTVSEKHQLSEETPTNAPTDLISIQMAIEHWGRSSGNLTNDQIAELQREIESLPSATCDDCIWHVCNYNAIDWDGEDGYISKRDAINAIENTDAEITAEEWDELTNAIKSLPSAEPKTGHWITDIYKHGEERHLCSNCGKGNRKNSHYCPNCGSFNGGEEDGSC